MEKYYKAIQDFHEKFKMKGTNSEDMIFRISLMAEELGEIAEVVTKGGDKKSFIEENVDLINLIVGNLIAGDVTLEEFDEAFWKKHKKIMNRKIKKINGRYRISEFKKK